MKLFIGFYTDIIQFLLDAKTFINMECDKSNLSKMLRKNAFELKIAKWLDKNTEIIIKQEKYNFNVGMFVEICFNHYLGKNISRASFKGHKDIKDKRFKYTEIKSLIVDLPHLTIDEMFKNDGMLVITESNVYRVLFTDDFIKFIKDSCSNHINTEYCCFKGRDTSKYFIKKPLLEKYGVIAKEYSDFVK